MLELIKRFSGGYVRYFVIGPACKLLEVFFDLLTPLVIARMIDEGVGSHDAGVVVRYGVLLFVMAVVGMGFTLVCQKMAALASQGMGTAVRSRLYRRINEFSHAELDRFGTPSLITRITNDINQIQLALALGIRQLIRWPFLAIGSMVAALLIDLKLGLIFLISTPLIGLVFWIVMARCVPYFKQMQAKLDRIGLITREGLSGVRVIRAFVREEHERERFRDAAYDQAAVAIAVGKLSSILNPVTFLVMNLGVCAILWMGGIQVDTGELTQGEVMAFVNYMTQTLLSIVYVANLVVVFTKASASASRVNEVLHCEPSITDEGNTAVELPSAQQVTAGTAAPALRFDAACFAFGDAQANTLDNVTLQVNAGQTAAPARESPRSSRSSRACTTCAPARSRSWEPTSAAGRSSSCATWWERSRSALRCSRAPSAPTSPGAIRTRPTTNCGPPSSAPRLQTSCASCRKAWMRRWKQAERTSPADSVSALPSRVPLWAARSSSSWTTPPLRSTSKPTPPCAAPYMRAVGGRVLLAACRSPR